MDGSLGSLERDEEGPWKVVVNKARGKHDMRKVKQFRGTPAQCDCSGYLNSLDRAASNASIMAVEQVTGNWEKIPVTVDSGAIDSVIPNSLATHVQVKQTAASRQGLQYRAANGTPIKNEGEKTLRGYTGDGNQVSMTMQVAKVTKPLGSVRAMVKANNMVVFDEGNSYILDKATGRKTKVNEVNGAYVFDLWVPRNSGEVSVVSTGRFDALREQETVETGFAGLDDLM